MIFDFGRYNLLCRIGEGGMGAVYLARQKKLQRYCAIKVLHAPQAHSAAVAERFLREARTAAALPHPHLVNVFDCDQAGGQYFIAMEYIEGLTLGDILRQYGALPLPLALHWLNQAAGALDHVHRNGVVHRDIKPDNLMIDASGELKIMDLGLAKSFAETEGVMTMTGTILGTPHYISPEQIKDAKSADHRSDIYSLGISFYHMLTGTVPFAKSTSTLAICLAHAQDPMPSVHRDDPELTAQLDALITQMTAKDRDHRFQSMADLLAALQPWLAQYPLDQASQDFCAQLDLREHQIEHRLNTAGIDRAQIDSDISTATLPPATANPAATIASTPTPLPAPPKRSVPVWAIATGVVVIALVAGVTIGRNIQRRPVRQKPHQEQPATQPVAPITITTQPATMPAPVPEPPKTGSLLVSTEPKNAFVLFLGKTKETESGAASFDEIAPGKYTVEITLPGYRGVKQEVEIAEAAVTQQHFALERIPGTAQIESDPAGADVIVEGQLVGQTPCPVRGGDGEEVTCLLRRRGYEDATVKVTLKEEGVVEKAQLVPMRPTEPPATPALPATTVPAVPTKPAITASQRRLPPRLEPHVLRQHIDDVLERARRTPAIRWQQLERKAAEKDLLKIFTTAGISAEDAAKITGQMLKVVDTAQALPARDFETRHPQLSRQMMEIFRTSLELESDAGDGPSPGR